MGVPAVWVAESDMDKAETAHKLLEPIGDREHGTGNSDVRAWDVRADGDDRPEGKLFVPNFKGSEAQYYELFKWTQHPTFDYIRVGESRVKGEK